MRLRTTPVQKHFRYAAAALVIALSTTACTKVNMKFRRPILGTVIDAVKLLSVSPQSGPSPGGTLITLIGSGFQSGASVSLGTGACVKVQFVSSTELNCITPAGSPGPVDVTVTNPNQAFATLTGGFKYQIASRASAGSMIGSGGGISTGGGYQMISIIGQVGQPAVQTSTDAKLLPGVQGVFSKPY